MTRQPGHFASRGCTPGARGFTIIELMFSIVILSILIAVAAPSLSDLVRDQRIKTATTDVYTSLAYARSEAIKRNANMDIVPVNTSDWASGWGIYLGGTTSNPLKTQNSLEKINITGPTATITYQRDGRLGGATAPTFLLKSSESATITARCVRVDLSGRPNIQVDTDHDPSNGCN